MEKREREGELNKKENVHHRRSAKSLPAEEISKRSVFLKHRAKAVS